MFSFKLRREFAIRGLLIVVTLFNALSPTSVLAMAGATSENNQARPDSTQPAPVSSERPSERALTTISDTYYADSVRTTLTQNASGSTLYVADTTGFVAGDEVLVMSMQGTQAGQYETIYLAAIQTDRLELSASLVNTYDIGLGSVMVQKIPHLDDVVVASGGVITAHAWDGSTGGVVFFRAESVVVQSGGSIDVSGLGYRGGAIAPNNSTDPSSGEGPGGGNAGANYYYDGTGGGGGSYGDRGYQGHIGSSCTGCWNVVGALPGTLYGVPGLTRFYLGSGGGGGGRNTNNGKPGSAGQPGGGIIYIHALTVQVHGQIHADGSAAIAKSSCRNWDDGSGGAGSGGSIHISAPGITIDTSAAVTALGGSGNTDPQAYCSYGGKGGVGRIRLDYNSLEGTTNPPPGHTQSGVISVTSDSPKPVGNQTPVTLTVTVHDLDGLPVMSEPVELGIISGASLYINNHIVNPNGSYLSIGSTDANGVVTATLIAFRAGARTIGARTQGQTAVSQEANIEFTPGAVSANLSDLSPTSGSAPANGETSVNITVTAVDAYNNLIPNAAVQWQTTGSAVITPSTQFTNGLGRATAQVVDSTVEQVTVSAIVEGQALSNKAKLTFTSIVQTFDMAVGASTAPEALVDTSLAYNLAVQNIGGNAMQNVALQVLLPEDVTFTSHTAPVEPTVSGQTLSWDLDTFDAAERLSFTVFGQISPSAELGSTLSMQAEVSSSTTDDNLNNNAATVNTTVVDGHNFIASITPSNQVLGIGASAVYQISVQNTGLLAEQFELSLMGLNSAWYTFSDTTVSLSPGATSTVSLEVQINSCSEAGNLPFDVTVTSTTEQESRTLPARVEYLSLPVLSGFTPKNESALSSRNVTVSWRSDVPTTGKLFVSGFSEPFTTPSGVFSSVVVPDLALRTTYDWYVEAVSPCGTATSSTSQFTIGQGIVFANRNQNITLDRDYNQRVNITVRNDDDLEHTLKVSIPKETNPYDDILVNFIDSGSPDQTITLPPHTSRDVTLAIHAQDARQVNYDVNASLVADENTIPIYDNMNLHLTVLADGNFTIEEEEAAFDPITLARTYVITNHGKPVTDLSLKAVDPEGLPAQIFLQPSLDHARLETGQSIRVVAYPIYTAEDAVAHASLLASLDSHTETPSPDLEAIRQSRIEDNLLFMASYPLTSIGKTAVEALVATNQTQGPGGISFELLASGAGATARTGSQMISCGTTKQIIPVTLQDCTMDFKTSDWYCTNRPVISTPILVPPFLQSTNISSLSLDMTFQPHGNVLPHSTVVNFNDVLIGALTDMVPSGLHSFDIPVNGWKNGLAGNVTQVIDTVTNHSNDAHYVSTTGMDLKVEVLRATTYVCAESQAAAQQIVQTTYACKSSGSPFDPSTDVYPGSTRNDGDDKTVANGTGVVETDGSISITSCSTQESCGDPINTQTGVFSFTLADLAFPTTAGELVVQRSYSSGALDAAGILGYGWTHNHDAHLIFPTDPGGMEGHILFQSVLGNQHLFKTEMDGSFTPGPGVIATLTKSGATYTLTDSQQAIFNFDEAGRLTGRQDAQGRAFAYDYDAEDRLVRISADGGVRFIELGYNSEGQIDTVRDHAGRQVAYAYDAAGNLIAATDVLGQTWTYVYDSKHRMTESKDPTGAQTVRTLYDSKGRAYRQFDGEGNLIVQIIYNDDGTTSVYDALGNKDEHQYDERNIATQTIDPLGRTETRTFDDNFRLTEIVNSAGHALQMTWSPDGVNMESKIDPVGNQTFYDYDALNNLTLVTDARGEQTNYTYDGKLLTSKTDALGGETTYTYTPEGYLESVTDSQDRVTSYTYDEFGQRASMTDPNGKTWHYAYDSLGRLTDTTDPRSRVTHNEYNDAGQLVRVTQNYVPSRPQNDENQYNIVTEYDYDVRGNQIKVTDTYNHITRYVYDDADRLLQTIDPLGHTTINEYDAAGHLISTTDPLGHTTTYEYDATGRLVKTINALGYASGGTTTFDVSANTSTVTDVLGRKTVFHYDALGRAIKTVDPFGHFTTTTYDPNGNVAARTDPLGRTTRYEYDELNRLVRTIDPNTGVTETFFDEAGNRIATEDPLDHRTNYTYDDAGRLVATEDPLHRITRTEYDEYGRRTATVDAAGHRTTYTYDALDRVIAITDDDGHTTTTTYDALGNVLASTDANGHVTTTVYDNLNRPLTVTDAEGRTTTNAYDAEGNLITVTNALGRTTTYTYDALHRQVAVIDPLGNTTEAYYDALGNLFDKVDANGVVTHYVYDELNRQKAVILNHQPSVDPGAETNVRYEFVYNEVGNRVSVMDPNGHITTYGYDALNRVIQKRDPLGNTWTYTYDLAGNRISATDAKGQIIQYTYDVAGQLTKIDYPGTEPDVTFTYNLTGQRISMTDGLGTTTWTYDDLNRLVSVKDALGQTIGYEYDAAGNRTELTYPDGKTVAYNYDDVDHLVGVTDWDSQTTEYAYDAAGQLASVSRPNGISSQYHYDDAGRLTELHHNRGMEGLASYNYVYDPAGNRTRAIEDLQNPQVASISSGNFVSLPQMRDPASMNLAALQPQAADKVLFAPANQIEPTETAASVATAEEDDALPVNVASPLGEFERALEAGKSYSVALLHLNGEDAATVFTDETGKAWTATGDAQVDTAQAQFGGASAFLDGSGDFLSTPDSDDFHLANGDWTMDFWVRFNSIGSTVNLVSQYQDANNWMDVWTGGSGTKLYFAHKSGGSTSTQFSSSVSFNANTWYHIAIARHGDTPLIAINGVQQSVTQSTTISGKSLSNLSGPFVLGDWNASDSLNGWIDEFRFSKGIARWTGNFTPPAAEYAFTTSPDAAILDSPVGEIEIGAPVYTWNVVANATWYYLWVDGPSGNVIKQWYSSAQANCNETICSVTSNTALSAGAYKWWVQTWNEEGYGPWSERMDFTAVNPALPGKAALSSPNGSITTKQPAYTWSAVNNAAWYYLWVDGPSGNVIKQWYTPAQANCNETTCSITPTTALSTGAHKWWIQTYNSAGYGPWSERMDFNVLDPALPGKATLSSPSGSITITTPTYTWSAVPNSTWYYLWVNGPSGNVIKKWYKASEANCDEKTCSVTPDTALSTGEHKWWIQTYNSAGDGPWSDEMAFTLMTIPTGPVTIDYTYDALNRLESAAYSDGRFFGYTYDPAGNVLELQKNLGPGTVTTTYAYDSANQLNTAVENGRTWQYHYDANGSLIETLPDGNAAGGAERYTYNAAGYLMQVETHNGLDWVTQAEMEYNGLGQRLSMDAAGVITHYVINGNLPLTAASTNTTFYLYGFGPVAEKTNDWAYSLPDGANTPRQLTSISGQITLSGRYTPWGDALEIYGAGNFAFGYLGGVMDSALGLIYVGNGQYYDPATGRFLTRGVTPDSPNPYVPWNPIGAILGPVAIFSLIATRRRGKHDKGLPYFLLFTVMLLLPLSLLSCNLTVNEDPPDTATPVVITATQQGDQITATATTESGQTYTATATAPSGALATSCPTPAPQTPTPGTTPTPGGTSTPPPGNWTRLTDTYSLSAYVINIESDFLGGNDVSIPAVDSIYGPGYYLSQTFGYYNNNPSGTRRLANENFLYSYASVCLQGSGKLIGGDPITCTTANATSWTGVAQGATRSNIKFAWGSRDRIANMSPYETVAVCPGYRGGKIPHPTLDASLNLTGSRSRLWLSGTGVAEYFRDHGGHDTIVDVIDVGEGLCPTTLDIYVGDGLSALSTGYDDLMNGTSTGAITEAVEVYIQQ